MIEELIERLKAQKQALWDAMTDRASMNDPDFDASDWGNYDDVYKLGYDDGGLEASYILLTDLIEELEKLYARPTSVH